MTTSQSDALVLFGATGDLAHKKIFPALQAMVKRSQLEIPVIGVAKAGWNLEQLKARVKDSLEKHGGGVDAAAFDKLASLLRYLDGDYNDPKIVDQLKSTLGSAQRPLHYLAIPPSLFSSVVAELGRSGCAAGARVVVEKPFAHDLSSARALTRSLLAVFPEADVFRIDHYLGKEPVQNLLYFRFSNPLFEGTGNNNYIDSGQMLVELKLKDSSAFGEQVAQRNYIRFELGPDVATALGIRSKVPGEAMVGEEIELLAAQSPSDEMDAYQRLIGDALFAREDAIEEEWRIVAPILSHLETPIEYQPGT